MITLYEKAAKIAAKLESLAWWLDLRPEQILRKASPEEIDSYYERLCK
jgi:hypothetical protein